MKIIIFLSLIIVELSALNFKQKLILKTVKNIAKQYPNKYGKTFENTAMAICLTETRGGKVKFGDKKLLKKGIKKASYGIMQVRLSTARFVANNFHIKDIQNMSDLTLIKNLMYNNLFNIKVAVLYLVWCSNHSKSYFETVSRYNGGKTNYKYYNKIEKNLRLLKKYNL